MVNPLKIINDFLRYLIALFDVGGRGLKITPEDNPPNNLQVVDCSVSPAMAVPWKRELKSLELPNSFRNGRRHFLLLLPQKQCFYLL